jgi:hypothetical protein
MKNRDERRRRAREENSGNATTTFGTYSGAKIRGIEQLQELLKNSENN